MHELRIALKYATLGLLAGILLAPRTGLEARRALWARLRALTGRHEVGG